MLIQWKDTENKIDSNFQFDESVVFHLAHSLNSPCSPHTVPPSSIYHHQRYAVLSHNSAACITDYLAAMGQDKSHQALFMCFKILLTTFNFF